MRQLTGKCKFSDKKAIPLEYRGRVYDACVRSMLFYGSEAWPMTDRVLSIMTSCDCRILRNMAGICLQGRVRTKEVTRRCSVDKVEVVMRERR